MIPPHLAKIRDEKAAKFTRTTCEFFPNTTFDNCFKNGFNAAIEALMKMNEEQAKALRDRALNYFYEHGGTANRREAHGAAGHFEDGARFGIALGRLEKK